VSSFASYGILAIRLSNNMSENLQSASHVIRFGPFHADLQSQELRKHGVRLRLPGQSFQILKMLLERQGKLVTREELRQTIWTSDTFVDFDHGLSSAVNRLREALGDSADEPRFVETLPRRGYRFIGAIAPASASELSPSAPPVAPTHAAVNESVAGVDPIRRSTSTKSIVAAALAGAICILLATFAYLRWRHWPQSPSPAAVPFTSLPGVATNPAFSPDGSRIAFSWSGDPAEGSKGADLYVKAIGSEELLRLTRHPSDSLTPVWSPDGAQIAFLRATEGESGLFVVPAAGGLERKLRSAYSPSISQRWRLSWSPDGKSIAFADSPVPGGHQRLYLLSFETSEIVQIEHNEECQEEGLPVFSHDGRQLAYACFPASGDFGISTATSAGAAPRMIKEFPGFLNGLAWTGDDKKVIFSQFQTADEHSALRELFIADGSVRDLLLGVNVMWPAISAQGDQIAYASSSGYGNNNIWRGDLVHPQSPPAKLISSTRNQLCPQYSPDGNHIAFASDRSGSFEIWMSDLNGTNLAQLTNLKNLLTGTPSWSPDGSQIVFDSRNALPSGKPHADLYTVDITERLPRKLMTGTGEASVPSWSHNGKWIYFIGGSHDAGGERIYRVSPEGGRAAVLSSARGYAPQESLDGQSVYFAMVSGENTTLEVASLNPTGTEFRMENMPPLSWGGNWTLVRDGVYFFPANAAKSLSFFDFATKQVHPVFHTSGDVFYGTSVSPDGRYILYAQTDNPQSDIMLIDNFH
jgi:Tol biopolymer transport system component/DNA-binding winged helix-turn-helix (wHTH) protein